MRPSSLAVVGLGAIGGSLAWQARLAGVARVVGYSASRAEAVEALKASAITEMADTPGRAVRGADLVVLAVPPRATIDLIGRLGPALEPGAVLTDVCSVKGPVMARAMEAGLTARFAGGHPLAGTHDSGFSAARPDRLRGCVVYVCELAGGEPCGQPRFRSPGHDRPFDAADVGQHGPGLKRGPEPADQIDGRPRRDRQHHEIRPPDRTPRGVRHLGDGGRLERLDGFGPGRRVSDDTGDSCQASLPGERPADGT